MNDLLAAMKTLSGAVQNCKNNDITILSEVAEELSRLTNSGVVVIGKNGAVIVKAEIENIKPPFTVNSDANGDYADNQLVDQLRGVYGVKENISLSNYYMKNNSMAEIKKYKGLISPYHSAGQRLGTVVFYKYAEEFKQEDMVLAEYFTSLCSLIISFSKNQEDAEASRRISVVKSALGTLSYSEIDAIVHIFKELNGPEGLLVASKIADKVGITRSVIVNALRKFESAGVIESRSLGMKGTYIKVINPYLLSEINKLNV